MIKFFLLFLLLLFSCGAATVKGAGEIPQPVNLDLAPASDSGRNNADNITKDTTPTFTIDNIIPGATVELLRDNVPVLTVTGTSGSMSLTDPNALPNAVCVYRVRQTLAPDTSISPPLTITLDNARPTVTIDQAAGQADPAAVWPLRYTAMLSDRPVDNVFFDEEAFIDEDISTARSTNPLYLFVTGLSCDTAGTTCNITAVAQIPSVVELSVPENSFTDLAGNWNLASTSTDNVINFQPVPTTINFLGRVRRSGDRILPFPLTVRIFDTITNETFTVRPNSAGYFRLNNHPFWAGTSRTLTVRIFDKSGRQIFFDAFGVEGDRFLIFTVQEP